MAMGVTAASHASGGRIEEPWQRTLLWVWLTSSAVGVLIWHVRRLVNAPVSEWLTEHIITLSYFTNLTNTLIVVMAAALLTGRGRLARWFAPAPVQAAFSLYILFVGLAFWFVLGGPEEVEHWWLWIPEVTAHSLSPLLGVVWWYAAVARGRLRVWHPFAWLVYPIAYLAYWLVRGPIVGEYPYFFIDVGELGYAGVAVWTGILVAGFLVLGLVMWAIDRLRVRSLRGALKQR
jgi:lysylphosphatidylglycerol synthetase-like protein (DUF2156 family)